MDDIAQNLAWLADIVAGHGIQGSVDGLFRAAKAMRDAAALIVAQGERIAALEAALAKTAKERDAWRERSSNVSGMPGID